MEASLTDSPVGTLKKEDFVRDVLAIESFADLQAVRAKAIETENLYRELFARKRDSWEVPEIDDPLVFLVDAFADPGLFRRLPDFAGQDDTPRCFPLGDDNAAAAKHAVTDDEAGQDDSNSNQDTNQDDDETNFRRKIPVGSLATVRDLKDFQISWDCFSEGLLRFVDWNNVFCAGGAVAGCLAPLPDSIKQGGPAATRVKRRKYFHDKFLPGSDIDLFLYGLTEQQAEAKLLEIYDAVQAANPYEIRAFRSAHAVTLVSQYPFRHVQIVLRLYNSPAEILMGFDVDACAVGYDGKNVHVCPRTVLALKTQSNTVDMTRRSPSYELRLAKYAQRGFEVVVPNLNRDRVDPFLYEKRFEHTKGLARLLMLERLRTPMERLRYRIEAQLKAKAKSGHYGGMEWMIQRKIYKIAGDNRNVERAEGVETMIPAFAATEASNYCTVFLPWGPNWTAKKIEQQMKKKDRILNQIEFTADNRVKECERPYKVHVCAVGTMEEILKDPFPNDPPLPDDLSEDEMAAMVHGKLSWLVDNPGRQQIGSFHPITDADWTEGAYISHSTEALMLAAISDDATEVERMFAECKTEEESKTLLTSRDFLGRSVLHVAALARAANVAKVVLRHKDADSDFLKYRLADGRTALHLCGIRGDVETAKSILEKRKALAEAAMAEAKKKAEEKAATDDDDEEEEEEDEEEEEKSEEDVLVDIFDIDGADWEIKLNPLQYAIVLGHVDMIKLLISYSANVQKLAVHKDRNESLSSLDLLCVFADECGEQGASVVKDVLSILLDAGCTSGGVDMGGRSIWHRLAVSSNPRSLELLRMMAEADAAKNGGKAKGLEIIDQQFRSPLYLATACANSSAISILLKAGARPTYEPDEWEARVQQMKETMRASGRCRYWSSYYDRTNEHKRCPPSLAAQQLDNDSLKAFLDFDKSLANIVIQMEQQPSQSGNRKRQRQQTKARHAKLLDIVEESRQKSLKGKTTDLQYRHNHTTLQNEVRRCETSIRKINEQRDRVTDDPYKHATWTVLLRQEEDTKAQKDAALEQHLVTDEDERIEEEFKKIIDTVTATVKSSGGENHPDMKTKDIVPHGIPPPSRFNTAVQDPDPFDDCSEMQTVSFDNLCNWQYGTNYRSFRGSILSETSIEPATELLVAAAKGDSAAVVTACQESKAAIIDTVGFTPLFLAVKSGSVSCTRAVFNAAIEQYGAYVLWRTKISEVHKIDVEGDGADTLTLKDKLKRLNNLEIAAGETPKNKRLTPDEIRQRLEAAAESAGNQQKESKQLGKTSTKVSPEMLLVNRSIVLSDEDTAVAALKERLHKHQPFSFGETWLSQPVRLRPIELAVIRGDVEMVRTILEFVEELESLFGDGDSDKSKDRTSSSGMDVDGGDTAMDIDGDDEDGDKDANEEDDGDDDDEDSDDDDNEDEDDCHHGQQEGQRLTRAQLRFVMVGDASNNADLGSMNLLQLAIAANNMELFKVIAEYAREYTLPLGAVAMWKSEVDKKAAPTLSKKQIAARQTETNGIYCRYGYHQSGVPSWAQHHSVATNSEKSLPFFPVLQFALVTGAYGISAAILDGSLNGILVEWMRRTKGGKNEFRVTAKVRKYHHDPTKPRVLGAAWACRMVRKGLCSTAEAVCRLVGPCAIDCLGRNALYYAPADMIAEVVSAGVRSVLDASLASSEADALEAVLSCPNVEHDIDPLKAAVSAGQVDRVQKLIEVGCKATKAKGEAAWNAVHFAIPNSHTINRIAATLDTSNADTKRDEAVTEAWAECRRLIDVLLSKSDLDETVQALACPESEHSPLMMAVSWGADVATVKYLISRLAARSIDVVKKKNASLNTLTHLCAERVFREGKPADLATLRYLLDMAREAAELGPNVENSSGVTPTDVGLQQIVSIWQAAVTQLSSPNLQFDHALQQRRSQIQRPHFCGIDAKKLQKQLAERGSDATTQRQALSTLQTSTIGKTELSKRSTAGFDEVKEAKRLAAKSAGGKGDKNDDGTSFDMSRPRPAGMPAVCAMDTADRHRQDRRRRKNPAVWNHWPR